MKLTFLGAAGTVTGSKYLLHFNEKNILVDCGLYQGHKEFRLRNWAKFPIDPSKIDAVIITHAHIDHSGYLPLLVKNGYTGKIYCTHGTKDLCSILLPDSGHIAEEDAKRANKYNQSKHKPALPLYTLDDALHSLRQFVPMPFDKTHELFPDFSFELVPAGHIIGASIVKIYYEKKVLTFTGDLGRPHDQIMKPPAIVHETDYLVTESTYGNRQHEDSDPQEQLTTIINETIARGGSIIIPAFSVGRTQSLLYHLYMIKKAKKIADIPVYLDSPMAQDASDLLNQHILQQKISGQLWKEICRSVKYVSSVDESKALDTDMTPKIILSASGMAEGGRILHHLKTYLRDARHTILFTGYQDGGTRGDRLLRGDSEIKIYGEMVPAIAQIKIMENMSAHADYKEILGWMSHFSKAPKKIFITHGTPESAASLKEKIEARFRWKCLIPDYMQSVVI
jgi:metallo-beta-lactamase family protein